MTGNKDEEYFSDSSEEEEEEEEKKEYLDADDLTVHIKRKRSDYEERIESIKVSIRSSKYCVYLYNNLSLNF